tara:strand:- start:1113 stop:1790 length:678 start_codon:yes stop_codon:yes gene_type:complete
MARILKRLLIIPARGGSKRIINKNIKIFMKKPVIYYAIKESLKSKLFSKIHVTTDSNKIFKTVSKIKKNICFYRPKSLAGDKVPLMEVFKYVVKNYQEEGIWFKEIWFLNPCSPLIKAVDLNKASRQFKKQKNNSLLSISKFSPPIEWAFFKNKNILIPRNKNLQNKSSQAFKESYYDTGNLGIFSKDIFYKNKKPIFSGYELPRHRSVDIDTIEDWNLALKLYG